MTTPADGPSPYDDIASELAPQDYEPQDYAAYDEPVTALGAVVEEGRGSLPFALVHGESLVACAAWALGDAGITALDTGTPWSEVQASGEPFVLHDTLCPLVPADFLRSCLDLAVARSCVVVGVRPVTDTVKVVGGDEAVQEVGETVDRADLVAVASPIVLPASVVAALDQMPDLDFAALVSTLRARFPLVFREAPPEGRRISGPDDLRLLEALTAR
ncbi:glycosyltransferase family protein [Nocardioides pacificus]